MNQSNHRFDGGSFFAGLFLIGLGVLFLLNQFHVADLGDLVGRYWPLIIVAVGIPKLFRADTLWAGLWLVAVGSWLQAVRLHLYDLTFRNSWPLLLILFGSGIVLRTFSDSFFRRDDDRRSHGEASHEHEP